LPGISGTTARRPTYDDDAIQGFLGHRNITHTVKYTDLAPDRFQGF
jgi:type 1 fimbriae regulatory protein FimB/type 1 fimbriae regulatory protein FimE